MGLELNYINGQTPLDEDEKDGLLIKTISTRGDLDEFEQLNIDESKIWLLKTTLNIPKILSENSIKELHSKMFGNVWRWAGSFRNSNKNIINQGLYYLDWLLDHKAEFQLLVMKKYGKNISDSIEWENARLICIAGDYTKYDSYAVEQINRNIELIRYRKYKALLLFELVNTISSEITSKRHKPSTKQKYSTVLELLNKSSIVVKDLFESIRSYLLALGDDVQMKELLYYFAFKRIKNFASVEIHPQTVTIVLYVKLSPWEFKEEKGFIRDVSKVGHLGTGNVEIKIKKFEDFEKAKPLILKSYEFS